MQEIARRLGLDWNYTHPRDVFAEMAQMMPSLKNITWDRLLREGAVTYPCDSADGPGNEIIFATGYPTESGRGKLVPTNIVPPDELPDADYPMVLSTGRLLEHWHTGAMTRRATMLDDIEPEAVATALMKVSAVAVAQVSLGGGGVGPEVETVTVCAPEVPK